MRRILKIDAVNRYAMVEPGVTYGELMPEIRKQGLRLSAPLLPRASKSVVASRLEREPVLIPKYQYDYLDPLLTLEVIYGTGDDFRTGSASGPGTLETLKADKVNPWGPGAIDFYRFISGAQGTMGLVTWAITKTEVLPSIQKLYFIPIEDAKALAAPLQRLLRQRVVDECLALDNVYLASILAENRLSDFDGLRKSLPAWTVIACVAGYQRRPEERVAIQERYLIDICRDLGLQPSLHLPGAEGKEHNLLRLLSEPWTGTPYWKLWRKGSCRDLFFLSPLSRVPEFVSLVAGMISQSRYPADDVGCYIQPMVQGRGCHCEFNLPCDETDPKAMDALRELFMTASETLMANGAFFSRPYGPWADMVYRQDGEEVKALKRLKAIFDPNNILNPGKVCF
jgi:FAD/FMN-containing dehydrogenase